MKTGIALSGGGARGIAHLGVLEALEESGIRIDMMAGTSAGAIAAALYAIGNKPREIKKILKENSYFGLSRIRLNGSGIFNMEGLKELLQKHIGSACFEDLPVKIFVAATDMKDRKTGIFSSGSLLQPLLASACVPFIFEPVSYQGKEWVDGGILNNFPVEPLKDHCDYIIGSHVNKLADPISGTIDLHKMHILERCFHMAIEKNVYAKSPDCNIFLDPDELSNFGMFDIGKADEIFEVGYRNCLLHTREWKSLAHD